MIIIIWNHVWFLVIHVFANIFRTCIALTESKKECLCFTNNKHWTPLTIHIICLNVFLKIWKYVSYINNLKIRLCPDKSENVEQGIITFNVDRSTIRILYINIPDTD